LLALLLTALWVVSVEDGQPDTAPADPEYSAADSPRLEFSLNRGGLRIDGHMASRSQEQKLLRRAAGLFPDAGTGADFKPLGTAPDHWEASADAVLEALSVTQSARAVLSADAVRLRGVGKTGWPDAALRLRAALPPSVGIDADVIIADDSIAAPEMCERAFASFRNGAINFEESTTTMRQSALPALYQTVSLADACRDSFITITGHTDSSGPEALNRDLSLARANAVADFLQQAGIERSRLITVGAGSSQPVATNTTRYGRGLNRRIEIGFRRTL